MFAFFRFDWISLLQMTPNQHQILVWTGLSSGGFWTLGTLGCFGGVRVWIPAKDLKWSENDGDRRRQRSGLLIMNINRRTSH